MKRSIILFPDFENIDSIKEIRGKYDPLANFIAPHITLVFPFDNDASTDELKQHFDIVLNCNKKFEVLLSSFTGDFRDGYLFLNIKTGNDDIIELHDKLYSGILERFLFRGVTYYPHLTVGKLKDEAEFYNAVNDLSSNKESFRTMIDKVYVEKIDSNEKSIIEFVFNLK